MARIVVRFFDDETVEGVARDLDFDEPDFLVEVDDAGGLENNETAWIPLTAVKWVELPRDPDLASETPTRKVAIRFLDGEVLRGHLDGTLERHRYGVVLHLHAEQADSPIRKLGIPFSAVKALFFVREFDARGEEAGTATACSPTTSTCRSEQWSWSGCRELTPPIRRVLRKKRLSRRGDRALLR